MSAKRELTSRIDEIKARLEAATPGPLHITHLNENEPDRFDVENENGERVCDEIRRQDFEILDRAPSDLAYCLGEIEKLRTALTRIETVMSVSARQDDGEVKDVLYEARQALEVGGMTKEERAKEIIDGLRKTPDDPSLDKALRILDFSMDEFVSYIAQALPDLPSDEDLTKEADSATNGYVETVLIPHNFRPVLSTDLEAMWLAGARWMRERIAGRDKA